MITIEKLRKLNPKLDIKDLSDTAFKKYGQVLEGYDFTKAMDFINQIPLPSRDNDIYILNSPELCEMDIGKKIKNEIYGGVNIDIGYCLGICDSACDLMEYHRCDEFIVSTEDPMVMPLGDQRDIVDNTYDLSFTENFFVPPGVAVDLYATTLHGYSYQTSGKGYRMLIALIQNTNKPIDFEIDKNHRETKLLTNVNAFIMVKSDEVNKHVPDAYPGPKGPIDALRYR